MNQIPVQMQKREELGTIVDLAGREVVQDAGAELAQVVQESKRTQLLRKSLPLGISIGKRTDGRPKPFFVRFGPDRTVESFETESARNRRADTLAAGVSREGTAVLDFNPAEWRQLQEFKRRTGVSLAEAEVIVNQVRGNLRLNLTVSEAIVRYKALRSGEGLSRDTTSHTRLHLERLEESFGALPLFLMTPEKVREWMDLVRQKFGLGSIAVRHHRKTVHMFFERALIEKWTTDNPCKAVVPPKVIEKETTVLKARDIFELLKANREEPVIGKIALELYGFLRCSSVERIRPDDVKWSSLGIVMHGSIIDEETGAEEIGHKSKRRKFRQGHPPIMWAWLKHAGAACWSDITSKNYDERKKEAFTRARVENPGNVLRHSCASYVLAATKNFPYVSYMMQHTSLRMTERYEGIVEELESKMVLAMTPEAVLLEWGSFVKQWKKFYRPIKSTRL